MAPPLDVTLSRGVLLPLGPPATRGELFSIDTFGIVGVMTRGDDPGAEAPPPPAPAPEPEPAMAAAKLAAAVDVRESSINRRARASDPDSHPSAAPMHAA